MCQNPSARFCNCQTCREDKASVMSFPRDNKLGKWLNSEKWTTPSTHQKVRGECWERYGVTNRFVVQGAVSGVITWK